MDEQVSAEEFRKVMGLFATGVTIVTTRDLEGHPYGLTVNSFTSVSLNPRLVLVCLDNRLSGLDALKEHGKFGINILAEDQQQLSNHFATPGTDRSQAPYLEGTTGVPMLEGALASLECEVTSTHAGGDHTVVLGQVKQAEILSSDKDPLLYYGGGYRSLRDR